MAAENGVPAEVKRDGTYCPNCDMKGSTYHGALRILRCGSIPTDDNKHLNEVSPLCDARKRIAELEAENKRLRDLVGKAWEECWKAGRDEEDEKSFEDFLHSNGLGEG